MKNCFGFIWVNIVKATSPVNYNGSPTLSHVDACSLTRDIYWDPEILLRLMSP